MRVCLSVCVRDKLQHFFSRFVSIFFLFFVRFQREKVGEREKNLALALRFNNLLN